VKGTESGETVEGKRIEAARLEGYADPNKSGGRLKQKCRLKGVQKRDWEQPAHEQNCVVGI